MKKNIQILLLLVAFFESKSQEKRVVDSLHLVRTSLLEQKIKSSGKNTFSIDTSIVANYQNLITAYWNMDDDSVLFYGQKSLALSEPISYQKGIANGYNAIGYYFVRNDSSAYGFSCMNKALLIRKHIQDYYGICRTLSSIGLYTLDYKKGLAYQMEALEIAQDNHVTEMEPAILHNIGDSYSKLNNPAKAIEYYLKAKAINEQPGGNLKFLAANLNSIGMVYSALSRFDKARGYFQEAISLAKKNRSTKRQLEGLCNLPTTYDYTESDKSIPIYLEVIQLAKALNKPEFIRIAYLNLGDVYYFKANYEKALFYDTMAFRMYAEAKDSSNMANIALNIGMVFMQYKQ